MEVVVAHAMPGQLGVRSHDNGVGMSIYHTAYPNIREVHPLYCVSPLPSRPPSLPLPPPLLLYQVTNPQYSSSPSVTPPLPRRFRTLVHLSLFDCFPWRTLARATAGVRDMWLTWGFLCFALFDGQIHGVRGSRPHLPGVGYLGR